mgnify:CR=1 FL=1
MSLIKMVIREVTVQIKGAGYKVWNFRGVNSYNGKSGELFQIKLSSLFRNISCSLVFSWLMMKKDAFKGYRKLIKMNIRNSKEVGSRLLVMLFSVISTGSAILEVILCIEQAV